MTRDDVRDAILQLTVTEHYYTGVQDVVSLLCDFNGISVKVCKRILTLSDSHFGKVADSGFECCISSFGARGGILGFGARGGM